MKTDWTYAETFALFHVISEKMGQLIGEKDLPQMRYTFKDRVVRVYWLVTRPPSIAEFPRRAESLIKLVLDQQELIDWLQCQGVPILSYPRDRVCRPLVQRVYSTGSEVRKGKPSIEVVTLKFL